MKKITIAIDAKELAKKNIGSLGMILLELIPRLLPKYEVLLLSDIDIPAHYVPDGVQTVIRNIPYCGGADLLKYQYWMKKICEKNKADWFYQINHFSLFKMKGVKQIVVIHDLYPLEEIEHKTLSSKITYWVSLFFTMINADVIFTVSEFTRNRLSHFFWKSRKVQVNYNGIAPVQKAESEDVVDGKFFLMLGRVSYWKGTLRVAEFFSKYFANSKYKLIIAGQAQKEEDAQKMKSISSSCHNIVWLDYVNDMTRDWLLQNAELFLYASRYDGFGLPPLEAAKMKTKVLMNDIPVLREVTLNKGNYVDFYGEDDILYKSICTMIEDDSRDKIEEMYMVATGYTWDAYANRIKDTIERG